jgi:PAS domain S-box-containing protein
MGLLNSIINYYYYAKIENGKVISIHHSPNCEAITGYTIDEFEADRGLWQKIVCKEDREKVNTQLGKLLKKEPVDFIEHRIHHKNGTVVCLRHKLVPYYDDYGNLTEYDGLVALITDWKKQEEALRLSEIKYRKIFEHTQDIYYRVDTNGILKEVSPSVQRYSGYTPDELIGTRIESLYANISQREKLLSIVWEKGEIVDYEIELKSKTGGIVVTSVNSHVIYDSDGKPQGIEGSLRDITERKVSDVKIKKLNQAIEQSPASIVITDVNGIIEYVNSRFTLVTGYPPENVIGKKSRVLKSDKLNPEEFAELWSSITKGEPWKGEYFNRKKNGEQFWESLLISPILDEHGEVTNFVIITEDITEKKQFLKDLIDAKEKAEKGERLKSQFLAQMSHEIRTPINSIINFTEILREKIPADNPATKHCFDVIDVSCMRIIRTIDMILRMSEIQAGTYDCTYKLTNLFSDVIEKIYLQFKDKAAEKKLEFTLIPPSQNIFVQGDQFSLESIFINLIDNAITYTPQGKVEIEVFINSENLASVSVKDTGIGISDDFLSDIFKPFVQEDQGYSRRYDGNGLGLALVKSYCGINNASISVESKKGAGSKFTVTFNKNKAL